LRFPQNLIVNVGLYLTHQDVVCIFNLYLILLHKYLKLHIMIVATPLDLPLIQPDNWDVFWNIWNTHATNLVKTYQNHKGSSAKLGDTNIWKGLDIYKKNQFCVSWDAPYYDIQKDLPLMYQMIKTLPLFAIIDRIRVIESLQHIDPHTDDNVDQWNVRAILHYTDSKPQWIFTKPGDKHSRTFLSLPENTNWFAYNDKYCWHGFGLGFKNKELLAKSMEKYKEYTISYE